MMAFSFYITVDVDSNNSKQQQKMSNYCNKRAHVYGNILPFISKSNSFLVWLRKNISNKWQSNFQKQNGVVQIVLPRFDLHQNKKKNWAKLT